MPGGIRRISKIPGVIITQHTANIPEGKSVPDFKRKVNEVNVQEGKLGVFKALVTGEPKPQVTWKRGKDNVSDKSKYQTKYDESTGEYILEVRVVMEADEDTYKCIAVNDYGKAICSTTLNITDHVTDPSDFRKLLRKSNSNILEENQTEKNERDERYQDTLQRDYGGLGTTDRHLMHLKMEEREGALKYQRGKSPPDEDFVVKNGRIHGRSAKDAEILTIPNLDFDMKLQKETTEEKIECVLTQPLPKSTWMSKANVLEDGKKYKISLSDHKMIHQLQIQNCSDEDNGDYSAMAGNASCTTPLDVEAAKKKTERTGIHFEEEVGQQQLKNQEEIEDNLEAVKARNDTGYLHDQKKLTTQRKDDQSLFNEDNQNEEVIGISTQQGRKIIGPLIEDKVIDPGVQFIWGFSDINAIIGDNAELTCKLNKEDVEGVWYRDGEQFISNDKVLISKEGAIHKLFILKCQEEHSGKYCFEADNQKTEAVVSVKDPPRFDPQDLTAFTEPLRIKVGHNAVFKLNFLGFEPIKIQWYREEEELHDDASSTRIHKATNHSRLMLTRCQRRDSGEIKIKLKNEHGTTEAITQLIVLDKPTTPLGPAEITLSSATCIEFKWRPPKDDGGSPLISYIMERRQIGRNTWKKIGEIPGVPFYRDTDLDRGRKYCYRIRALTAEGVSEVMETEDLEAGILAFPSAPGPPKVISAFHDCINLTWTAPSNTGGSQILGYIIEKRKKGSNLWTGVNASHESIKEKKCAVKDVVAGLEYEFRVLAVNLSGPGEFSNPCDFVFARDPKKPPGKVIGLKVVETSYNHFVLTWTKPQDKPDIEDEAKGYFVEIRNAQCLKWSRIFTITTTYTAKSLRAMDRYWVRVSATNDGGEGEINELNHYVLAMPPLVRPRFTDKKMKTFMVVRAGNSVRVTINFDASPSPDIMWFKDNGPVPKRVTVSNSDSASQMLIALSERSDSGTYSVLVKNLAGQVTFGTEVRVTDDPKPPGPVEIEENVPGTVQVTWQPSPDEKLDDRLHYTVSKLDSTKHTWTTVADRLFNNKFTVCNIMHGRDYHFRVYAKNDMGLSVPSESPTWVVGRKKEKLSLILPNREEPDLRCAPDFIVPLKLHAASKGYECHMSCAVTGNPKPRITWYRNHVNLNTDTNYYISNTCGVCSLMILSVAPKDVGKYTVTAENALGRSECSTMLSVKDGTLV
ncbi:immunoglobulin-like and fibronectin type III domain-containing protein 1 [Stigmatopora nigra]